RSVSGDLLGKEVIQLGRQPYTNWIGSQKAKDRELVSETIEQMNIGALADRKLKTMSDGEIQKILLARALAQNTAIVLLDEPSAHLDLYNKALLFQQIKKIVSLKQKTILFTSHDLNSAIQICDKILLLLVDRWEFGTPDELIQRGVFQTVFPKETVGFDPLQKQFKICI
ncbi:MAG: ABC transporter ATP-binding protein, partial [Flavobacteriaceae bacterium]|nr:ABC transporter ATP-binding protein [Flavobacteriaceae bacterium]